MSSYQYRNSHYKDKTVLRPFLLYDGNAIHGKTVFILRRAQIKFNAVTVRSVVLSSMSYRTVLRHCRSIHGAEITFSVWLLMQCINSVRLKFRGLKSTKSRSVAAGGRPPQLPKFGSRLSLVSSIRDWKMLVNLGHSLVFPAHIAVAQLWTDRVPWSDSLSGTILELLGPPTHLPSSGIGFEKRSGFHLRMVGDKQGAPVWWLGFFNNS